MRRNVEVAKHIKDAFEAKAAECIRIAREKSGKEIPMFPLVFSQMGHRAGVCSTCLLTGESTIKINPDFFKTPKDYDEQLNDTLPHELAHAVIDILYPLIRPTDSLTELANLMTRRGRVQRQVPPHGRDWERVMKWFGITNPNRTHKMDMTAVAVRKKVARPFNYLCGCGIPHPLTFRLHKRIQEDGKHRKCTRCKQRLIYERQWGKPLNRLKVEQVTPKVTLLNVNPSKPRPVATHKWVTRFENGSLRNVRVPLTTEEKSVSLG